MMQHHNTLEDARNLIASIQENLNQIYAVAPTLNGNNVIHESLIRSAADFKQAAEKLAHPALRIATIGTTSAGKSTLVNGLIGRQIAPMDAGEMSAGILHLVHSDKRHLKIEAVKNLWEKVDAANVDDTNVYEHVREKVFKIYHEAKQTQTIPVPTIRVEGELLPAAWSDLLQLPAGVNVEFFDLPGLNNINDKDNFKVIQNYLEQCFSLVVMNYLHTDSASRAELFKEVKKIVDALGGKTDAMIFVLNAVDSRSENDDSLEDRIKEFANAIQKELKLKETPNIIPVSARALFYAQCTWGWNSPISGEPTTDKKFQVSQLKKFSIDCAKFLKEHRKHSNEVKNWLRDIEDAIDDNDDISNELLSTENLKLWVEWTWQHSGGLNLWGALRQRVNDRFSEIVIAPTLIQPLASLEVLLSTLNEYSVIQRQSDKEAVEEKKIELEQKFKELKSFLEQESLEFEEQIKETVELISSAMASQDEQEIDFAIKKLFGIDNDLGESEAAEKLNGVVAEIKMDLRNSVILPVRNYYLNGLLSSELSDELGQSLPPEQRDMISKAAERYKDRGFSGDVAHNGYKKKVKRNDVTTDGYEDAQKSMAEMQNACHILFREIRSGLTKRASYMLQTRDHAMQQALSVLLQRGMIDIEKRVHSELPESSETLIAIYRKKLASVPFNPLPEDIFELEKIDAVKQGDVTKHEGSCFKTPKIEKDGYVEINLPDASEMADMWYEGVNKAESQLWTAVAEWFAQSARIQNVLFQDSLQEAQEHLMELLNQRLVQSEAEYQEKLEELDKLEALSHSIAADSHNLKVSAKMLGVGNE
jgi:predicted GTPase